MIESILWWCILNTGGCSHVTITHDDVTETQFCIPEVKARPWKKYDDRIILEFIEDEYSGEKEVHVFYLGCPHET